MLVPRVSALLQQHGRCRQTSAGAFVVTLQTLSEICAIVTAEKGRGPSSLTPKMMHQLEREQVRKGEYSLLAILKLLHIMKHTICQNAWDEIQTSAKLAITARGTSKPSTAHSAAQNSGGQHLHRLPSHTSTIGSSSEIPSSRGPSSTGACSEAIPPSGPGPNEQQVVQKNKHEFSNMTTAELHATLKKNNMLVGRLQARANTFEKLYHKERRQRRRLETRLHKLQKAEEDTNNMDQCVFDKKNLSVDFLKQGTSNRLSTQGILACGIRRNMTNVACCDFGVALMQDDLGRYKVARCEVAAGVRLQAASREFYMLMNQEVQNTSPQSFSVGIHSASSDATGGNILKNMKLSNAIVESVYYFEGCEGDDDIETLRLSDLPQQKRVCDLMEQDGGTAADTIRILAKQFKSVGCPDWLHIPQHGKHLHLILYCSDKGPDQAAMCGTLPYAVACEQTLFMPMHCFDHSTHLIDRKSLQIADARLTSWGKSWKYYGTNTRMCYIWRAGQHKVFKALLELCGAHVAQHAIAFCALCDAARWGGWHEFEDKVLTIGSEKREQGAVIIHRNKARQQTTCPDSTTVRAKRTCN